MVVVLWLLVVPLLDEAELLLWLASLCGIADGLCSVVLLWLLVDGVVLDCEELPVVEPVAGCCAWFWFVL